ncbi:hypothetical protein [Fluviicola chungangensis]|uniref:DUF3300 domain-containing protein n=1 Tax=Fluviicola chungangensis TaxID=2597671 RepID=A0A556N6I1_9FLAO|nr:hypothetical protein [Fluviicola chungangensis]TSJ47767.1 hypothetical protein FO442_01160 [Fluviicola chungangensis]
MKRLVYLGLIMLAGSTFNTFAQESDSTGMPGDNFDLQGALNLFKESKNLEDFEKKLNSESSKVNNLDLNGDNKIDYIRVIDKKDGDNHAILLQVPINKKENQDIAAIGIEKRSDKEAQLQIIGNETIYGEETIMEPVDEKAIKKSTGPASLVSSPTVLVFVNVWYWPCVQYIYDPFYDPWYSPYYWDYYPSWWYPWRPVYYVVYYQRMSPYHGWCHYTPYYQVPHAHAIYVTNHSNSNTVRKRYETQRSAYKGRSSYNNQSANGSKGRIETTTPQTVKGRTDGTKNEPARPITGPDRKAVKREVPRPVRENGGTIRDNHGNTRTVEPARRNPTTPRPVERPQRVTPQPRPVERPQRVTPQPQRQTQPVRRAPVNRPVIRPSNGGGRGH